MERERRQMEHNAHKMRWALLQNHRYAAVLSRVVLQEIAEGSAFGRNCKDASFRVKRGWAD